MKGTILILTFFCAGILFSLLDYVPQTFLGSDPALFALWVLMGLVGISLGANPKLGEIFKSLRPDILLMPMATTVGTFAGAVLASLCLIWTASDCLAIGAGFAYYSLSSVIITQYKGAELGAAALLCNVLRELFTLILTPLVVKLFGPVAAISCGGASTMDTTLPVISQNAGPTWIVPSIIHAMILDFSVPFWLTIFCVL